MAGFECSTHRRKDRVRLDLIRATAHDKHVASDYRQCLELGVRTVRHGLRWHLIEADPEIYDWSSWLPMLEAAAAQGVQVVWDVLHYGSPDWISQGDPEFVTAYARFAAEAVRVHRSVTGTAAIVCPINEISFFTWLPKTAISAPPPPTPPASSSASWCALQLPGWRQCAPPTPIAASSAPNP